MEILTHTGALRIRTGGATESLGRLAFALSNRRFAILFDKAWVYVQWFLEKTVPSGERLVNCDTFGADLGRVVAKDAFKAAPFLSTAEEVVIADMGAPRLAWGAGKLASVAT